MEIIANGKLNAFLDTISANLEKVKLEVAKFSMDGQKKAAAVARKHLMVISKTVKQTRKQLQEMKVAMPVVKRIRKPKAA